MAVRDNLTKYNQYLRIGGGTLKGTVNTKQLQPVSDSAEYVGVTGLAYKAMVANNFALFKDFKSYGGVKINQEGTEAIIGTTLLALGNNIPNGTSGNARGAIMLFGNGAGYTWISTNQTGEGAIKLDLPAQSGTFMLKENYSIDDEGYLVIDLD